MRIATATPQDFTALADIYNRSVAPFYEIYTDEEKTAFAEMRTETAASMAEWSATRRLLCAYAEDGVPMGYAAFRRKNPSTVWISALYIDPDRQHGGFGSALLQSIEKEARQHCVACVALETHQRAAWALQFYQQNGYAVVNDLTQDYPYNKILDKPPVAGRPLLVKLMT